MPTIRELVEEAEENYTTGRYGNSSQLFKRAALETLDKQVLADPFYLAYRSLRDFEEIGQTKEITTFLMTFVKNTLKQVVRICSKAIEEGKSEDIISLLKIQIQALQQLEKNDEVEPIIEILVQELNREYQRDNRIEHLQEAHQIAQDDTSLVIYLKAISKMIHADKSKLEDPTQFRDLQFVISIAIYLLDINPNHLLNSVPTKIMSLDELDSRYTSLSPDINEQVSFIISVILSFYEGIFSDNERIEEIQSFLNQQFNRYNLEYLLKIIQEGTL